MKKLKTLQISKKPWEFSITIPALEQTGNFSRQETSTEKDPQSKSQTVKEIAIGTYTSIIALNATMYTSSTKRHRLV